MFRITRIGTPLLKEEMLANNQAWEEKSQFLFCVDGRGKALRYSCRGVHGEKCGNPPCMMRVTTAEGVCE